jgi:hypothetical protein
MTPKPDLAAILQDIVNDNPGYNLLRNSYFRVPKNNPEFLKKYKSLKFSKSRGIAIVVIFLAIPKIVLYLITNLFGSILLAKQYKYFKINNKTSCALFVSHGTNNNLTGVTDVYFSDLPSIIGKQKCTILYLNHNKVKYKTNFNRLSQKSNCANSLLMPKFLRPTEFAQYLKHCLELLKIQRKISQNYRDKESFKAMILIHAIKWIFSRESYTSYLVNQRIKEINSQIGIDIAFFTLEGHSYEEIVANSIKSRNDKVKLFFYQHSPITKAQKGVENFLRNLKYPVTLLTTGPAYSNFLLPFSLQNKIFCIGSNKIIELISNQVTKINTLLVAPEGTTLASNQFIRYLIRISRNYQNYKFILRLHPNLRFNISTALLKMRVNKLKNVHISNQTLLQDLQHSQATLYRSSTVALETLKAGNIPIFVDFTGDNDLNVYTVIKNDFPILSAEDPSLQLIESLDFENFNFKVVDELYISFNPPKDLINFINN